MKIDIPYLNDLVVAVKQLVTRPLPIEADGSVKRSMLWFPVVGLLTGLVAVAVISLFIWMLPEKMLGVISVCGAVVYAWFLYFINGGRGVNSLLKTTKVLGGQLADKDKNELTDHVGSHLNHITVIFIFFCKIIVSGTLIYHGYILWLILAPVCSATTLALFLGTVRQQELKMSKTDLMTPWFIALGMAILLGQVLGFAVAAVAWFVAQQSYDIIQKQESGLAQKMVFGVCELMECAVMLAGLLLFTI